MNIRFTTITSMILMAALTRIIPHPWNFTPVAAMALFAGASMTNKKWAYVIPFLALLLSDLVLGFHNTMIFVYGAFALTVWMGTKVHPQSLFPSVIRYSLTSSLAFFFITNVGVWLVGGIYEKTFAGLTQCFVAAIPFFRMTLLGDLLFNGLMFGSFYSLEQIVPAFKKTASTVN